MKAHRYLVLDGLRGVAALAVLVSHVDVGFALPWHIAHGYLGVDFFFLLSGFVLAHAYDGAIATSMSFQTFFVRRLIRLYPMIFASAMLAALSFNPGWTGSLLKLLVFDAAVFTVLPLGLLYNAPTFPGDIVIWSLFFELVANAVFYFCRGCRVARAIIYLATTGAVLAAFAHLAGQLGNVGVTSGLAFMAGFARVAVSFGAGVLIFRFAVHERFPVLPDFIPALVLAVLFALPISAWGYDMACVLLGFPLLLCLGARASTTPGLPSLWGWAGILSYPVYVMQEPVLRAAYRLLGTGPGPALVGLVAVGLVAYALLRFYDEPVRSWLARRAN